GPELPDDSGELLTLAGNLSYDVFVDEPPPQDGFFPMESRSGSLRWRRRRGLHGGTAGLRPPQVHRQHQRNRARLPGLGPGRPGLYAAALGNHGDVTSPWSEPLQSYIAVVGRGHAA